MAGRFVELPPRGRRGKGFLSGRDAAQVFGISPEEWREVQHAATNRDSGVLTLREAVAAVLDTTPQEIYQRLLAGDEEVLATFRRLRNAD